VIFRELPLAGAFLIELEPQRDERGLFARTFCEDEFRAHGLEPHVAQCNVSWNARRGTLRGLHYQAEPHAEAKLVRCARGAVFDVIVDLRRDSPSRGRWHAVELDAAGRRMLFVPAGFAQGFQTLADDTEVLYQMSTAYRPELARGIRWDDPTLSIKWPETGERIVSERDRSLPFFE
jgi:dTDP-4-dehydrorhamnose 3,5-epimerase